MKLYTHDEAARILEVFEDLLDEHNIRIPSPEDDERGPDNDACLYGSTYSDLLDEVEEILIGITESAKTSEVVKYEFSGAY